MPDYFFSYSLHFSWTNLNYRDPGDSLMWLWDTLLKAEENNEKVHIIGHSPPNTNEFISGWAKNFAKIIDRLIISSFYHLSIFCIKVLWDDYPKLLLIVGSQIQSQANFMAIHITMSF